jgi:hypothetical protein
MDNILKVFSSQKIPRNITVIRKIVSKTKLQRII